MTTHLLLLFCFAFFCAVLHAQEPNTLRHVEINVVDEAGKPLSDATINVTIDGADFPLTVGKKGVATLDLPYDSNSLTMTASSSGRVPLEVRWQQNTVPAEFTFTLSQGQTLGGIVHDERGEPVEGVLVEGLAVSSRVANEGEVRPVIGGELGKTDAQGAWQAACATPEPLEMRLKLTHEKYFSDVGFGKRRLTNEQIRNLQHIEVLEDRLVPQGSVKTTEGKPVADAKLYVITPEENITLENGLVTPQGPTAHAVSDKEGKYEFVLQEGEFRVFCLAAEGWANISGKRFAKNEPVEITLTPWARVEGVLMVGTEPAAAEKLQLEVVGDMTFGDKSPILWKNHATTNPKGEFTFERLTNGYAILGAQVEYCDESDHNRQDFSNEAHVILLPGMTGQVTIKREGVRVAGTVVPIFYDGSEALISCGRIQLEREDEPTDMVRNLFFEWGRSTTVGMNFDPVENAAWLGKMPKGSYVAKLDEEGSFTLQHVPPGKYLAHVKLWVEETDELPAGWLEGEIWEPLAITPQENGNSVDLGLLEIEVYESDED